MAEIFPNATVSQAISFDGKQEAADAALALAITAHHEICFLGSELDSVLLDTSAIVERIKQLCIGRRRAQIRLLVSETQNNLVNSHRLLPLITKLTSSISLRILSDKHRHPANIYMLMDQSGYLRCLNNQRYAGQADLYDPYTARELKQQFDEYWNYSTPDTATRRLFL